MHNKHGGVMYSGSTVVYKRSDEPTGEWSTNVFSAMDRGVICFGLSTGESMLYVGVLRDDSGLLPVNPPCKSSRTYCVDPKRDLKCLRIASETAIRTLLEMYKRDDIFIPAVLDEEEAIGRVRGIFPNEHGFL